MPSNVDYVPEMKLYDASGEKHLKQREETDKTINDSSISRIVVKSSGTRIPISKEVNQELIWCSRPSYQSVKTPQSKKPTPSSKHALEIGSQEDLIGKETPFKLKML